MSVPMDLWGPWGWIYGAQGVSVYGAHSYGICGAVLVLFVGSMEPVGLDLWGE